MKTKLILMVTVTLMILYCQSFAQGVAISNDNSNPDASAMLDVKSTDKGMLVPRMTTAQRTAISNPANGLLVFDSTTGSFWFFNSGNWTELTGGTPGPWVPSGSNISYTAGNVGIGDDSPASSLTVGNGDKFQVSGTDGDVTFTDDEASIKFPPSLVPNSPMIHLFSSGTLNADRMVFSHSPSFPLWGLEYDDTTDVFYFRSSSARKMAFELSSGDFGIGTENPALPFDMVGRARIQSDGTTSLPGIWFSAQDNDFDRAFFGMLEPDSTIGIFSQHLNKFAIQFEVMREPRIGVNTVTPRSEVHLIHTNFGGQNDGLRIENEGTNYERWNLYTSNATGQFEFYSNGLKRATIDDASGAYTAVSDERVKTNIGEMPDVLSSVISLKPKTYQFIEDKDKKLYSGFLAQELEKVFPQFVFYGGDDQVLYTVDYAGMSVVALKAIQEQQTLIENLQQKIEELEITINKFTH
jgi:hypothetical protein